ncbi:MAG: hypothetical protein FKY71_18175, partial [Spiribacter salinus]
LGYSLERKTAVLKRMLPPNSMTIRQLSQEEALRANKRETIDRLKFTLEGAGERIDGHALTDTAFVGCRIRRRIARRQT